MAAEWTVIVPVKPLALAKTRLEHPLSAPSLALAFAQDAVTAALSCPLAHIVAVATSDIELAAWARAHGATVVDDADHPGINPAVEHAATELRSVRVAAMLSDLPCLTPQALTAVLTAASVFDCSFLPDRAGTGTTIWTRTRSGQHSHFGVGSAAAHREAGAVDLSGRGTGAWHTARLDVDTLNDLELALDTGVGAYTRRALLQR